MAFIRSRLILLISETFSRPKPFDWQNDEDRFSLRLFLLGVVCFPDYPPYFREEADDLWSGSGRGVEIAGDKS